MTACVIPGCNEQVANPGDTCPICIDLFGTWLRPSGQQPLSADEIRERDAYVARAYYAQRTHR